MRRLWISLLPCLALTVSVHSDDRAKVTYSKQISRILQNRCQGCHHPGTAAPFGLLSYEDARNWGETALEAMEEKRMPPWFADPSVGHFSNDRSLSKEEFETFQAWVEDGMPKGDPNELPEPVKYAEGWQIGKPDLVLTMDKEFDVPATGVVRYKYFKIPHDFDEEKWVQAVELKAGNPEVVHHILMSIRMPRKPGQSRSRRDQASDERAFGFFAALAPGSTPAIFPPGFGKRIPKGAEIVFQIHYTPNGTAASDRSSVALIFARKPVHTLIRTRGVFNAFFKIPPGESNHPVKSAYRFPHDSTVISFMPHMHLRGKSFSYTAEFPDGTVKDLLGVPKYDFNWQLTYELATPLEVPKGTIIRCFAHYDNSEDNPANPDPKRAVGWGDQTWDEMMIGYINYYVKRESVEASASE